MAPETAMQGDPVLEGAPVLALVKDLCRALEANGILYCHWKSNAALGRSATGEEDLDLLVADADMGRFCDALGRLGFKEAPAPPGRRVPGIRDYYGLDAGSGKWVHVHAHRFLVLGHDATKNYHLPLEAAYLKSTTECGLFRVPAPEFEWVLFVIRMVLKHGTWDAMLSGHGMLSSSERRELAYLEARVDRARVHEVLERHLPSVGAALFENCVSSLLPGCSLGSRAWAAYRLECSLQPFARRPQAIDVYLKLRHRLVSTFAGRVLHVKPRKRAPGGGLVVAIVGGDGAGKSTAVDELSAWLFQVFMVTKVHLGKPRWSTVTLAMRGGLRIGRLLGLFPFVKVPLQYGAHEASPAFPGYPWLLRQVCTARDRYLTYRKAWRVARRGGVVLCDRYPLPQVLPMDGPCVERYTAGSSQKPLVKWLGRLEKRYYEAIVPPQLLLVLKVDPTIAVQRKADEDADSVHSRSTLVWQCDWERAGAQVIDAGQSREQVLSELKVAIWARL